MSSRSSKAPTAAEFDEQFVQQISAAKGVLPNSELTHRTVIKAGPRTYKVACILQFTNPDTGEITHRELRLNSYKYLVGSGIDFSVKERLCRWDCRDEEITRLRTFLEQYEQITTPGTHRVVPEKMASAFDQFITAVGEDGLETPQLLQLVSALADQAQDLRSLPELGEQSKLRMVAAAIRVAHRSAALTKLRELIAQQALEREFQKLLDQNWWMLGNHYIEHIERRNWTTDETVDIMLRSADSYFDIIELKRSNVTLFKKDHGKWVITADVADAVSQAAHYISEIERTRPAIFQRHHVDLYKLKAKVLIGFVDDDGEDVSSKREALRMYNSHLHRIEVITYDELARIAENVIDANAGESGQEADTVQDDDSVPF